MSADGYVMLFDGPGLPLRRVAMPLPAPVAGEVLVRVLACTLCGSDLHTAAGRRPVTCPTVLGHEILGRIETVSTDGPPLSLDGRPLAVGDRVVWAVAVGCGNCFFCSRDLPQKCERLLKYGHEPFAGPRDLRGGLATHVLLAPRTAIFRVPDGVPDFVACPAGCATATVMAVLRQAGALDGVTVLIFGAGLLGLTAAAVARSRGARAVIVADPDVDRLRRATAFGATHAVGDLAQLADVVHAATEEYGVDLAVELSGVAAAAEEAMARVRIGGRCLWAGTVLPTRPVPVLPETVVRRHLTIQGVHNYHPNDLRDALAFLATHHRDFPFANLVGPRVALADAAEVFRVAEECKAVRLAVTADGYE
ncbi:MAG TPA: zinc-binding dehydrogenase [Gemmataceae bacterium]|nr:zinc-binding dehydrogenase [Gemmataceae bacterium]